MKTFLGLLEGGQIFRHMIDVGGTHEAVEKSKELLHISSRKLYGRLAEA